MKTHKPATLYETTSYVTAMCVNPSGNAVVSAHLDGTIYTYWFESPERGARLIGPYNFPTTTPVNLDPNFIPNQSQLNPN